MPGFRHLIFDLDGTLVDTLPDIVAATNYMLGKLGRPHLSKSDVCRLVGLGARNLVVQALGFPSDLVADRGLHVFMEYYNLHLADTSRPFPGVEAVLRVARIRRVRMAVVTNKPERAAKSVLEELGLTGYFDYVIGGDTLGTRKPDPNAIYFLQKKTKIALEETILVGDSDIDARVGQAAGIATCLVSWGYGGVVKNDLIPKITMRANSTRNLCKLVFS